LLGTAGRQLSLRLRLKQGADIQGTTADCGQPLGLSIHSSVGFCSYTLAALLALPISVALHARPHQRSGRRRDFRNHGRALVIPPRVSDPRAEACPYRAADGGPLSPHTARFQSQKPPVHHPARHSEGENLMMRRRRRRRLAQSSASVEK